MRRSAVLFAIMKILFAYVTKQASLMRRSTVLSLPLRLAIPGLSVYHFLSTVTQSLETESKQQWPYSQHSISLKPKNGSCNLECSYLGNLSSLTLYNSPAY